MSQKLGVLQHSSNMFPVGHGSQNCTMTSNLEGSVMPGEYQGKVFFLRSFEQAVNVLHQDVYRFFVESIDRFINIFLA